MSHAPRRRICVLMSGIACVCLSLGIPACKEQATPQQAETPADQADATSARTASATLESPPPRADRLIPDDDNDQPGAPAFLPRSDTVAGWIKTRAVWLQTARQFLESLEDSDRRAEMAPYRIMDAARCGYEMDVDGTRWSLEVCVLRCRTPDDAFGLFATQRTGRPVGATAQVWCDEGPESLVLQAWQATCYLWAEARPADVERLLPEAEKLLARILLGLPAADPPPLLSHMPTRGRRAERMWFVRGARSLSAPGAALLTPAGADAVDGVLRLKAARGMVAASYEASPGEPPNNIWLVEYESPSDASAAYESYRRALALPPDRGGSAGRVPHTLMISPVGRFLAGSWSAEQESAMYLLPGMRSALSRLEP